MKQEPLSPEQLLELTEKEFHDSNKLWADSSNAYANASLKLFDDMMKFVFQMLTSMGIIAGFGFAGIQYVKNLYLFGIGEFTMFSAMMFGFYRIKYIYKENSDSVDEKAINIRKAFQKKAYALSEFMKEIRKTGTVKDTDQIKKYEEANQEILEVFGVDKEPQKMKDESWFINYMIVTFIIGFLLLLASFHRISLPGEESSNSRTQTLQYSGHKFLPRKFNP